MANASKIVETQVCDERTARLAQVLELQLQRQAGQVGFTLPYGEINFVDLAEAALRHLASDAAMRVLFNDIPRIVEVPVHHVCTCPPNLRFIRHEFGRGSRCVRCGLPA